MAKVYSGSYGNSFEPTVMGNIGVVGGEYNILTGEAIMGLNLSAMKFKGKYKTHMGTGVGSVRKPEFKVNVLKFNTQDLRDNEEYRIEFFGKKYYAKDFKF